MAGNTSNGHQNGDHSSNSLSVTNEHTNGHTNGHHSSTKTRTETKEIFSETRTSQHEGLTINKSSTHSRTFTSADQQVTVLRQTVTATRAKLICDISQVNDDYIDSMTLDSLLEFIESERLTNMPQQGSRWDKVLKWAEFFALQISGYENAVSSFVPHSKSAAKMIWASCRVLIEIGSDNSQAIETAFAVLHKVGLSLSFFLRHHEFLASSPQIRTQVGHAFNDMLILVRDITAHYHIQIMTLSSSKKTLDFNALFGRTIDAFYSRKDRIIEAMWASKGEDDSANIHAIRMWLSIHEKTTKTYLNDCAVSKASRDEYTCEWFQRPLLDFSRGKNDILAITGPTGSGKSMLSGWIVERLQRPIGRKTYETFSLTIDIELPEECTSFAIAKNLALQLLRSDIGDFALLKALNAVYSASLASSDVKTLEDGLWKAINIGTENLGPQDLIIIVDGLDDRCGYQTALNISNRIAQLARDHKHVRAIILARNSTHFSKSDIQLLPITPDLTHFDLRHIGAHALNGCQHYVHQNPHEREAIVEKLAHAANGNFLWIQLMGKLLQRESSHDGFAKAVKSAHESPKTVDQLIKLLISTSTADLAKPETVLVLSWILVSRRPLTIAEIKSLLQIDMKKKSLAAGQSDTAEEIIAWCGPLIKIQNGIVRFRHGAIREHLLGVAAEGKKLRSIQLLQSDFAIRLLAYCKFRLTIPHGVAFEHPRVADDASLFLHDHLLEYAARNWVFHLKRSSLYKTSSLELSDDFKSFFPGSVQLAMIEGGCWERQSSRFEAVAWHEIALRVRQEVFTEKHESVLQNLITCGHLHKQLSRTEHAGTYFYRASRLGQLILKGYSTITLSCTTAFLEITETIVYTTRTEVVTRREECLKYAISVYKHENGKTSDIVIRYHKQLAELYVAVHEEHNAEICWKELRDIMVVRYGEGSTEEENISGHLKVVVKKGESHEEIIEYERNIFETTSELEVWDIRRIEITLKMAITYESHGQLLKAEECYVVLWSGLIEYCRQVDRHQHVDIEIHITMIDIAIEYVRFLRRHHRDEEAAGILICIWAEYEEYEFESEVIFLRLKIVGELMRAISLLSIAVSVFKKCWSWFKSHGKTEHTSSCQTLVSETIAEIVTIETSSLTTTTTTTTSTSHTVIKEIFESSVAKSTVSTVSMETISICQSFVSLYMKKELWVEAMTAATRSLELIWKVVITGRGTIALPRNFSSEAIDIALRLAICHHRSHHFHEAEEIYLRIYQACFSSCQFHDERFVRAYTAIIKFYEEHGHWEKVITIYQELLVASQKHHGKSHATTIKILYTLGSLCTDHGHGTAHKYYEEIILVLNGTSTVCQHDAFKAMTIMCRIYYEQGQWEKLRVNCEHLWLTWTLHHKNHEFSADFIELLYIRYIYVLEHHFRVEYEIIRRISMEFRATCVLVFGSSAAVTIKALIELGHICMRSEKYTSEAITYYEEVIKITSTKTTTETTTVTTTTVSKSLISIVKERLTKAYIHVCSSGSVTTTTIGRAIAVLVERFEHVKVTFGCAHTETLTILQELVILYRKLKTTESTTMVKKLLLETTILIISQEKQSKTLFEAAKSMGTLYVSCGLVEEGRRILCEMHRQIIFKVYDDKCGFKVDHSIGRTSFVFLVTFEETLLSSVSISYSKIMSDILTQTVLYESYSRCVKSEKNTEVVLVAAAKLTVFMERSSRKEHLTILHEEIHKIFLKKWGSIIKTKKAEVSLTFVISVLRVLGNESRRIDIGDAACSATNNIVRELFSAGKITQAYEVAQCGFYFAENHGSYHRLQNVGYGFKLSALMACRGLSKPLEKPIEAELHSKMLDLSRKILGEVLKACKASKINFVRMKLAELNDLVALLGEQKNYADLEWLLTSLWLSREVQKQWSPDTIISLSQLLIQARFLLGQHSSAIKLAEAVCYNLRRVYGSLDPKSLEMSDLLSRVYTAAGHHREAMRVHEEIIRLVVDGDDADDRTLDTMTADRAREQTLLLKQTFLRLKGWDKKEEVYKDLVQQLMAMPEYEKATEFADVPKFGTWSLKEKADGSGEFKAVAKWGFKGINDGEDSRKTSLGGFSAAGSVTRGKGSRVGLRRITSNWGMNIHLLGQEVEV